MMMKKCSKKSVRFAEEINVLHECREGHEDDDYNLMYTARSEYLEACKNLDQETKEIASQNIGIHLQNIYGGSFEEQINRLVALHIDAESARGLERYINDHFRDDRNNMRRRHTRAVLNQQQTHLKANLGYDQRSSVLASVGEEHSFTARLFARAVASADEKVARDDFKPTSAQQSLSLGSHSQRRTTRGKLADMVKNIGKSKSRRTKQSRRSSPTSSGEEFFESFDLLARAQELY